MNKFMKFLLWIAGVLLILQTVWFIGFVMPVDYLSPMVNKTLQTGSVWILSAAGVIGVVVGIVGLLLIVTAVCAPKKADQLRFNSSNGRLSISKSAVEKILQNTVLEEGNVNDAKVKLHLRTRNRVARVSVTAVDRANQDLLKLGETIQEVVLNQLHQLMDVEVKKVRVKVIPFDASQNRQKTSHPRVV